MEMLKKVGSPGEARRSARAPLGLLRGLFDYFLVLRPGVAVGPRDKKPRGRGVKAVEIDGFAGSERVSTAAIGIDDYLSLQRGSLRNQLGKPWTKPRTAPSVMIIYLISRD
jgi:hypothetical protein